ncbi:MAG TPA: haloalkane dehalogenase [Nitrososphaeraceae archaeon]|nr:haloalkane dehalogenase [Nitrososphaeraceae archaeon]
MLLLSFLLLFSLLLIITAGAIFLIGQDKVFGTQVSNKSAATNQTHPQDKTTIPYEQSISAKFPFESHYVEVLGSKMHYIDEGKGNPILFIHGNPTSSYLWRNIIPFVEPYGRVIAVDLIGMGKSDKPDIDYRFVDQAIYLQAFIEKLDLKNITLVIHDWGSALGFNYAMQHQDNVKGITFMEAFLMPLTWDGFPSNVKKTFQTIRTPEAGYDLIVNKNFFVKNLLPSAILRNLTLEEMNHYREPFKTVNSRKPVWVWPNEIPINGKPADVNKIVSDYNKWLQETKLPKLLFYAHPGGLINPSMVEWSRANLKNLDTIDLGQGIHYLQEDHPRAIGEALANWIQGLQH